METQTHQGPVAPPMKNMAAIVEPTFTQPQEPVSEPTLMLPGLGPVQARHMTIASVHFEDRVTRFMHSGRREFRLKAAPKGGISYLKVYDSQQAVPTWPNMEDNPEFVPAPVRVESIIQNLEEVWGWVRTSRNLHLEIGVGRIAGDVATEAEKAALMKKEERMCRASVDEADRFHASGQGEITAFHRACLDWLGSEKRPWYQEIQLGKTKVGPLSGQRIPMEALADGPHDLLKWYAGNGLDPADFGDTYIAELFKKRPNLRKVEAK